jgi:uncharacterized protein YjaZ
VLCATTEQRELQQVADVIPETGETGAASYPGNIAWTVDPDRDALPIIRTQLRPSLLHELHHLARASRISTDTFIERVVMEGLATAYERDAAQVKPPWGEETAQIMDWTRELLRQAPSTDYDKWMLHHAAGRRWLGIRVGSFLVDRALRASGKSAAAMVFASSAEIVKLADITP